MHKFDQQPSEIILPPDLEKQYELGLISVAQACIRAGISSESTTAIPEPVIAPTPQQNPLGPRPTPYHKLSPRDRLLADSPPAHVRAQMGRY